MKKYYVLLSEKEPNKVLKVGTFEECRAEMNRLDGDSFGYMVVEKDVHSKKWTYTSVTNQYYIYEQDNDYKFVFDTIANTQ